jgi:non-ribosomal peptide synthetase component F
MVILQNTNISKRSFLENSENVEVESLQESEAISSRFDLVFNFAEENDNIYLNLEYNKALFGRLAMQRMSDALNKLISVVVEDCAVAINTLDILNDEEKKELLKHDINNHERTFHPILTFQEYAEKQPDAIVLDVNQKQFTYRTINTEANQLAHYLIDELEVSANDLVGVRVERNEWLLISLLAIWKAGGAYLPIDTDYPEDRVAFMLKDSQCKYIFSHLIWLM